ncbi:MAG: hypothetical protein L7W43_19580 [Rubripirellula sp.]|nr:hypothetical protein [Rubripirellula sp.]
MLAILVRTSLCSRCLLTETRIAPAFYKQATLLSHPDPEVGNYRLKANVTKLQRDASKPGSWEARLNEDDISAWLIQQLPTTNYPCNSSNRNIQV